MVAKYTVVANVGIRHNEATFSKYSFPVGFSAAVNGCKLTYYAVVANFGCGFFAGKLQVLRQACNNSAGVNVAVFANTCTGHYNSMALNNGAIANYCIVVNNRERFYCNICSELSSLVYMRERGY